MAYPRNGPASRAVALDLMLRTFMNSAEFHTPNPKIWENIAKLVPGTTPQQCAQRWEELRMSHSSIAGDFSGLTATGRPISGQGRRQMSKFVRSMFSQHPRSLSQHEPALVGYQELRPQSVASSAPQERCKTPGEHTNSGGGKFVTNFCQTLITGNGGGSHVTGDNDHVTDSSEKDKVNDAEMQKDARESDTSTVANDMGGSSTHSVGENGPNMVIHVCDEAKKLKRNFICPRDILIREMRYFDEYLSSETQLWDEVDISVHCDVPVFEWLMKYAKRGMLEGLCGEKLSSPLVAPSLEPSNAISILISSEFLQMDTLVEECLVFCHKNISQVISSPSNMGCINDKLLARLAEKFTPLEIEKIPDKKDKIRSKLFLHQIQRLFDPSHSTPDCPANAATLYKCKHCLKVLTFKQQSLVPCTAKRLSVNRSGQVVYNHESTPSWDINHYLQSMQQQEGLTPRDIYWRLWGIINTLQCSHCHVVFQCCELPSCAYHPQNVLIRTTPGGEALARPIYMCCKRPANGFSTISHPQDGCLFRDHILTTTDSSPKSTSHTHTNNTTKVYTTLLHHRDIICADRLKSNMQGRESTTSSGNTPDSVNHELCLLQNEERRPRPLPSQSSNHDIISRTHSIDSHGSVQRSTSRSNSLQRQSQYVAIQQSHDYSEVQEDDEEVVTTNYQRLPVGAGGAGHRSIARKSRTRHTPKHEAQVPTQPVEWVWDTTKSRRLNQDMQRESDERRLAQLSSRLQQQIKAPPSNSASHTPKEVNYAGGIFSRLEAQFRVQQAAKAMALQNTQSRSHGSGRKR